MDYATWIDEVFNQDPDGDFDLYWTPDLEDALAVMTPTEKVWLITQTLENCGRDLQPFSNTQIAAGIGLMLWQGGGELYAMYEPEVSLEDKLAAIASIAALYRGVFAVRCEDGDANEGMDENRLHFRCYMLWDAGCVSSYCLRNEDAESKTLLLNTLLDVLEDALEIPHQQCQQSALHGLGHEIMSLGRERDKPVEAAMLARAQSIIDRYLARIDIVPWLREYAEDARSGRVQ